MYIYIYIYIFTIAIRRTAASAPLVQNLEKRVTQAANTRPIDEAFIPTRPQRTHLRGVRKGTESVSKIRESN